MKQRRVVPSWFVYLFGAMGGLILGYDTSIISGALGYLDSALKIEPNTTSEGFVTAAVTVGAIIGALVFGKLSDMIGRKKCVMIVAVIFLIGSLSCGFANAFGPFSGWVIILIARIISGIAVGGASALVPLYLSEISPYQRRGSLSFLNQLMMVLGILVGYLINFLMVQAHPDPDPDPALSTQIFNQWNVSYGWRISFFIAAIPAIFLFVGTFFLPESPRYLALKGKVSEARDVLVGLRSSLKLVDEELEAIQESDKGPKGKFSFLFTKYRKALVAAIGLAAFQQFMGCNTVVYYTPKILEICGFTTFQSRLSTVAIGVANVVATLIAIAIVDKFGRKVLFIFGGIAMGIFTAGIAIMATMCFHEVGQGPDVLALNNQMQSTPVIIATVTIMMLYIISFGISWGGAMWVVLGEIFPNSVRGVGVGVGSMTNWISNTIVTAFFPVILGTLGIANSYLILTLFCILGVIFVTIYLPETKGKTLEEIEDLVTTV
ncbi:MAG: sugar porter family MFS transporter [Candidatus Ancillula sp.]|jgi:sugar porter (SP) family MFS transporter|nr:sugar porter family MFS transporter [Candidatus Ancillula sp.]